MHKSFKISFVNLPTGVPVFLSLPHFLYGSNHLIQSVIGLSPNPDEHSIFLDVEPVRSSFHFLSIKAGSLGMIW